MVEAMKEHSLTEREFALQGNQFCVTLRAVQ